MKIKKIGITRRRKQQFNKKYRGGNKKNLAIILYGRINSYEYSVDYFNSVYKNPNFNCKVFCSLNLNEKNDYIENFCKLYNVGSEQINIEHTLLSKEFTDLNSNGCSRGIYPCYNTYSLLYHENKAFELLEKYSKNNNVNYDIVLVFRVDVHPSDPNIKVFPIENNIKPNTLYIPRITNKNTTVNSTKHTSNCYADGITTFNTYGDFNTMKKYCNAIKHITKINHVEIMLLNYLKTLNLNIVRFVHEITKNPERIDPKYNIGKKN